MDPVIKAIARLNFEYGLRTGLHPGGCWCHCVVAASSQDQFQTLWRVDDPGDGVVVMWTHIRQNSNLLGSAHLVFKLQLYLVLR